MTIQNEKNSVAGELVQVSKYPYYSDTNVAVCGEIKFRPEDFRVNEIPLYSPCGEGDHVYFGVEKQNMTTNGAAVRIAESLGVSPRAIGMAGQKDAQAVTTQTMSVEHVSPEKIESLQIPGIRILWTKRHGNKLKMGHLLGNRFEIRLRSPKGASVEDVRRLLQWLEQHGVPNFFGQQRFGSRGDTGRVGHALLRGDYRSALAWVLGLPTPSLEGEKITEARRLFDEGKWQESAAVWPRGFGDNAKLCRMFDKTGGHYKKTIMSAGKKALTFYVSGYQSELFNRILAARIETGTMRTMQDGDVAWKHDKGVCFHVEDAEAETARAERREISPSGPLFGKKMKFPLGAPGDAERALLASEQITIEQFSQGGPFKSPGGRRPLRIFPSGCEVVQETDAHGENFLFTFSLPAGAYATVLLREVCKGGLVDLSQQSAKPKESTT